MENSRIIGANSQDIDYSLKTSDSTASASVTLETLDPVVSETLQVPSSTVGRVIGRQHTTLHRIQRESHTRISIGRSRPSDTHVSVTIEGSSTGTAKARSMIVALAAGNYTHFLSLPLRIDSGILSSMEEFHAELMRCEGMDASILLKPAKFHLTLGMMRLASPDRVDTARSILESLNQTIHDAFESRQVSVRLRGLAVMKGDPERAHVLYVPVHLDDNRLLKAIGT
jgi:rRNA processing protein Krr1/Pno1